MLKNEISKVIGQSVFAVHCAQAVKDSEINGILQGVQTLSAKSNLLSLLP